MMGLPKSLNKAGLLFVTNKLTIGCTLYLVTGGVNMGVRENFILGHTDPILVRQPCQSDDKV